MRNLSNFLISSLLLLSSSAFANINSWSSEQVVDDFTDATKTFATVYSETGIKGGFITMGCYPGKSFELKVSTGKYIGDKAINKNVKYRVDKDTPVQMTMKATSKRFVYINDMDSQFIKGLMNGKSTVLVQLTSYDYDTSKAKFSLKGSTAAIQKVIDACK
ncbi:hypothetical protein VIRA109638_13265 [Vibrio rarus]|nr:hypothetical protein [Vibrio rarus]